MKVLAVANQKGGVAKTATSIALASNFAREGYKVLAIDLDPQANFTTCSGIEQSHGVAKVLDGEESEDSSIENNVQNNGLYDVLPSSIVLASAEMRLKGIIGSEHRIAMALKECKKEYDIVVIDTPPAFGILTINALTAADYVLIPAMADVNAVLGIKMLGDTIRNVRKFLNPNLKIAGILLTNFKERTRISEVIKTMTENAADVLETKLFNTHIRSAVAVPESMLKRTDLMEYSPDSKPAIDYMTFMDELKEAISDTEGGDLNVE